MLKIMSDQATTLKSDVVICRCQSVDLSTNTYSPMPLSIREDLLPKKNVFSSQEIANDFLEPSSGGHGINYSGVKLS